MAKIETQYVLVGRDQTQRAFRSLRGNVARAERAVFNLQNAFVALGAVAAIRGIAQAGIELERLQRGLKFATGSATAAADEFDFVRSEAERLGLSLQTTAQAYTSLAAAARGTTLEGQDTRDIFSGISEASRVLGLSADQTRGALRAIEQIISKGNVQAEELRGQLGERLPGAFQLAARSIGVTTEELNGMLERGEVLADELLPALAKELRETFGPQVEDAASDTQAAFARLETAVFELKAGLAQSGLLDLLGDLAEFFADKIPDAADETVGALSAIRTASLRTAAGLLSVISGPVNPSAEQSEATRQLVEALLDQADAEDEARAKADALVRANDLVAASSKRASDVIRQFRRDSADLFRAIGSGSGGDVELLDLSKTTDAILGRSNRSASEETVELLDLSSTANEILGRTREETEKTNDAAKQLGLTFTSAFEDAIIEAKSLRDVMRGLLQDIARIFIRNAVTNPVADFFGGLFEKRAIGGPVSGGSPYIVGERGPELFVPRNSGSIVPNNKMGGVNVTYNIDARGVDEQRVYSAIIPALERTKQQTIAEVSQRRREGRL